MLFIQAINVNIDMRLSSPIIISTSKRMKHPAKTFSASGLSCDPTILVQLVQWAEFCILIVKSLRLKFKLFTCTTFNSIHGYAGTNPSTRARGCNILSVVLSAFAGFHCQLSTEWPASQAKTVLRCQASRPEKLPGYMI